jgi:hypothetical protein
LELEQFRNSIARSSLRPPHRAGANPWPDHYIGIAQNLKSAMGQYAGHGAGQVGIDEAEAVRVLMENYGIVRAMFSA